MMSGISLRESIQLPRLNSREKIMSTMRDPKKMYQDFVKISLKVKFEKLHNSHSGRDIPEKALFKECLKRGILEKDWYSFILSELQDPYKYTQYIKVSNQSNKKGNKMHRNVG
jgi:hypothetical protein